MLLTHGAIASFSAQRVLPDVGAPASLAFVAVLGLVIFAVGLVAMLVTRRS